VTVVFKDLQKLVSQQQNTRKELFERLQGKPFWIWDKQQHRLEDIEQMMIATLIILLDYPKRIEIIVPVPKLQQ
jgi:hypothetical protein